MSDMMDNNEQTKSYKITACSKKATYEEEHWVNTIDNKEVKLIVTCYYRWGTFTINLTNSEKEEILKKDEIVLNDYNFEFEEMWDGDSRYVELQDEDNYSEAEIKKIYQTLYEDIDDEIFDDDFMESNGWMIDDTRHGFSCGCILEPIE
jgi:hypothetical protein